MTRKIIQIAFDVNGENDYIHSCLHALCDDGSIWYRAYDRNRAVVKWVQIDLGKIPQPEIKQETQSFTVSPTAVQQPIPKKVGNGWAQQDFWELKEEIQSALDQWPLNEYVHYGELKKILSLCKRIDALDSKYTFDKGGE